MEKNTNLSGCSQFSSALGPEFIFPQKYLRGALQLGMICKVFLRLYMVHFVSCGIHKQDVIAGSRQLTLH